MTDLTRIERHRTDFTAADNVYDPEGLNALNERYNAMCERIENLFISIELDQLEREEQAKLAPKSKAKRKPSKRTLFEDIDEETLLDLQEAGLMD